MKAIRRELIYAATTAAAIACILLGAGCASLGNGELDGPVVDAAKNLDRAAIIEAAAAGASGDYAKALAKIGKAVAGKTAPAASPLEGFTFSRTYFVEDIPTEARKITWRDQWTRPGSAGKSDVPQATEGNAATSAPDADDALAGEIADILIDMGLADK